jgi:diguanylate cyclase (GGDEF)-like protein
VSPKRAKTSGWPFADGRHRTGGPDAAGVGRLETLARLVEYAADLLAGDSSAATVVEIADRLAGVLGFEAARVCLWDAGAARLLPLAAERGGAPVLAAGFTVGDRPHASLAIYDQSPAFLRAADIDVTAAEQAELSAQGFGCRLTLPLVHEGGAVGVVELSARHELDEPGIAESVLATGICRRLAAAVHHGDSFDPLRTPGAGGAADVRKLAERLDVTAVLTELARHLVDEIGVTRCDILVRKADPNAFGVVARYSAVADPERTGSEMHVTLGDWGARAQAVSMQCAVTSYSDGRDLEPVQMAEMALLHQRATMTVPIVNDGEVAGLLSLVETRRDRRFTEAEIAVVEAAARSVSATIAKARQEEELKTQNEELRLLLEIGAAISSSMDLNVILSTITERLVATLGVAWSNIYDYHADTKEIVVINYYQIPEIAFDPEWLGSRFDRKSWPDGHLAAETRQPQVQYYDYASLSPEDFELMREWGEKATLSVPLVFQNEVVGVIDVAEARCPRTFTDAEIRLVTAIAAQAAVAIHNARLFDETRQHNEELAAMLGAAETLTSAGSLEAVLHALAKHLRIAVGTRTAEVYDYDEATHRCRLEGYDVADGVDTSTWEDESPPDDVPCFRECMETRRPVSAHRSDPDLPAASRAELEKWGDSVVLCVPMVYGDELLGVAYLGDPEERQFSEREIGLATGIAAQGAAAINNARAFAEVSRLNVRLAEQAITDGLTGLYNHRHLDERLEIEVTRAERAAAPLSVLMIDIDNFKQVNDTYGHPQGDKLLKSVAETLSKSVRDKVDIVARFGGEEFVVLLPGIAAGAVAAAGPPVAHERSAADVAESIRVAIEQVDHEGYPGTFDVRRTVSIGVASMPEHSKSGTELLMFADRALYVAKRAGKNRVSVYAE